MAGLAAVSSDAASGMPPAIPEGESHSIVAPVPTVSTPASAAADVAAEMAAVEF
jgi:hypothetical protein